jgi:hypothetical protein
MPAPTANEESASVPTAPETTVKTADADAADDDDAKTDATEEAEQSEDAPAEDAPAEDKPAEEAQPSEDKASQETLPSEDKPAEQAQPSEDKPAEDEARPAEPEQSPAAEPATAAQASPHKPIIPHQMARPNPSWLKAREELKTEMPTPRNRRVSLSTLRVIGAGTGGLAQLHDALHPSAVRFALFRMEFGQAPFTNSKIIFMDCVGEQTPQLVRARATAHKFAVQTALGQTHAAMHVESVNECSPHHVLSTIADLFAKDGNMPTGGVGALKTAYNDMISRAKAKQQNGGGLRARATARQLGLIKEDESGARG